MNCISVEIHISLFLLRLIILVMGKWLKTLNKTPLTFNRVTNI
jgi:hypothetical protein